MGGPDDSTVPGGENPADREAPPAARGLPAGDTAISAVEATARGIDVKGGQGVIVGQGVQYNQFILPPPVTPPGTVVAGNVPLEPPAFQPREDLLERLRAAGPGVSVVRAVTGMRGVGKTELAAAFARECIAAGWRLVAWVSAEDTAAMLAGLAIVADGLGLGAPGTGLEVLGALVRSRLEADGERCVIVFDNVTDLAAVRRYLPSAGRARAVVTSCVAASAGLGKPLPVDVFTPEESLDFLAERTGLDDAGGADALAAELGYLPLALAQAAAVIATQRLTYAIYLNRLRSYPVKRFLPVSASDPYPRGAAEAILLSVDTVATAADEADLCGGVLGVISLLSPEGVPRDVLHLGEPADVFGAGPLEIDEALGQLANASLLTFSGDGTTVTAHRLVMRAVRERAASAGSRAGLVAKAAELLGHWWRSLPEPWLDRPASRDFARQVIAFYPLAEPEAGDAVLAKAVLTLGQWAMLDLLRLGESPVQVIALGKHLLPGLERWYGRDGANTLACRHNLATAYQNAGRVNDAIPLHEQNLTDYQRTLRPGHPDTLQSRNNLARAYQAAGRVNDAIPLYEQNLADRERTLGPDHPDTMRSRSNLVSAYQDAGRDVDVIPLHEHTLADREHNLRADHPDTLQSRDNLARAYQAAGRLDDAIVLHERNLADRERTLGADHPDTLQSGNNLALAYQAADRIHDAIPLHERTLTNRERTLGPEHPDTLASRNNLATAYQDAGRDVDAIPLHEQTLTACLRTLGPEHPDTLASRNNLATAYQAAGHADEAVVLYQQALAGLERVLGPQHPLTSTVRRNLAQARRETEDQ